MEVNPYASPHESAYAPEQSQSTAGTPSGVLPFAFPAFLALGIGSASRLIRPYAQFDNVHIDALAALLAMAALSFSIAARWYREPVGIRLIKFNVCLVACWIAYGCGWSLVHGNVWEDFVVVCLAGWSVAVVAGTFALALRSSQ